MIKVFSLLLAMLLCAFVSFGQAVAPPTITPAAGNYQNLVTVTISSATAGALIFYTTDGSTPTVQSTEYTAPLLLTKSETIKAIAVLSNSSIVSASYVVNPTPKTYPYVLTLNSKAMVFDWASGNPVPPAQILQVGDSSPCPPPTGIPTCHWGVAVATDKPWLSVSAANGTTSFTDLVSVNTSGLNQGSYSGNITLSNPAFVQATVKIPVTLNISLAPPKPISHSATLSWQGSPSAASNSGIIYNVYRAPSANGNFVKINNMSPKGFIYSDTNLQAGADYCYAVTAADSNGNESLKSNVVCVKIPTP